MSDPIRLPVSRRRATARAGHKHPHLSLWQPVQGRGAAAVAEDGKNGEQLSLRKGRPHTVAVCGVPLETRQIALDISSRTSICSPEKRLPG